MKCEICNNERTNRIIVKERMINKGDSFEYFYCDKCGTLFRGNFNKDISLYYDNSYYSFEKAETKKISFIKRILFLFLIRNKCFFVKFLRNQGIKNTYFDSLFGTGINTSSSIMDVGCGSGKWLEQLFVLGFRGLTGIDLYAPSHGNEKIKWVKKDFLDESFSSDRKYDLIAFNHSFEHFEQPRKVLRKVKSFMHDKSVLLIRIPLNEGLVWDEYKENWYQIDAPRHIFLFSERSMRMLVNQEGLEVFDLYYDSWPSQFYISKQYKETDKSLKEISLEVASHDYEYRKLARKVNSSKKGDMACFYIRLKS